MLSLLFLCYVIILLQIIQCTYSAHHDIKEFHIRMPLISTEKKDEYISHAEKLDFDSRYIESVFIEADSTVVHHVATSVCFEPAFHKTTWSMQEEKGKTCHGEAVNLGNYDDFSASNVPFTFPKNVSLKVGTNTSFRYFVMQIHFRDPVTDPKYSVANVTLRTSQRGDRLSFQTIMFMNEGYIPPKSDEGFFSEIACPWKLPPVYAFRYYAHTHHNGYLVEGFIVRNGTWTLIGSQLSKGKKRNYKQIPGGPVLIQPGDALVSRCLYINTRDEAIKFGTSNSDEMCNFQLDIGYEAHHHNHFRRVPACTTAVPKFNLCDFPDTSGLC